MKKKDKNSKGKSTSKNIQKKLTAKSARTRKIATRKETAKSVCRSTKICEGLQNGEKCKPPRPHPPHKK